MVIVIYCKPQSTLSPKCDHYYLINFKFCHFPPRNIYILKKSQQNNQICNTYDLLQGLFLASERHQFTGLYHVKQGFYIYKSSSNSKGEIWWKLLVSEVLGWGHRFLFNYLTGHKRSFPLDYRVRILGLQLHLPFWDIKITLLLRENA